MTVPLKDLDQFEAARHHLGAVAYRLLGSAADAEDAVQETYLRWAAADRDAIEVPRAWLTRVLTRYCLDQLTSARARREDYVGQWLPEPLLDGDPLLGPAETVEQRDSVSLAFLGLLESLAPQERAVFVLKVAFSYPHAEIAEILGTTVAGSQQAFARARRRLQAREHPAEADRESSREVVEAFLSAAAGGDLDRLIGMLSEGAVSIADGGGKMPAARRPIVGAQRIATVLRGVFRPTPAKRNFLGGPLDLYADVVNGSPALLAAADGHLVGVIVLELAGGRIRDLRIQANPGKLGRMNERWSASNPGEPLSSAW
ncbi:MAG: RNA polymerase sigma factor SigJ [Brachybacterium sp.]